MQNRLFFTTLIFIWILLFGRYTLVHSSSYKNNDINFLDTSIKNVYVDSDDLDSLIVYFESALDISSYRVHSVCLIESSFLYSKDRIHAFSFKLIDKNCKDNSFYLQDNSGNRIINTDFRLNIISEFDLYNKYTDYSSQHLSKIEERIKALKNRYKIFSNVDLRSKNPDFVKKAMYYRELDYNQKIIKNILLQRQFKYEIPILGSELPRENINKLPNGPRPYRASYTNGIHEGWDIDAPLGEEVFSIDSGVIVRVVRDFNSSNLSRLKLGENLSYEDKINNLDILRGNQVWLKTMKGDVVFYAHLDEIHNDIQVGSVVPRLHPLGKVGKTGVPDKDYEDYHLHFELRKNPYVSSKAGRYSLSDYMKWDRYFKGESREHIKQKQYTIFKKGHERNLDYKK